MLLYLRLGMWIATSIVAVLILTLPISVETQRALGLTIVPVMIAMWLVWRGKKARMFFLTFGTFIVIRYIYWRVSQTMPSPSDPLGFGFGLILITAELYCCFVLALTMTINIDPVRRSSPRSEADEDLPTVDVFIPSYNEDEYILSTTMAAARSMDYPQHKLKVWLLDDGGTDQKCNDPDQKKAMTARLRRASLQQLCKKMGAEYLTRAANQHAKAGNMNSALVHTEGEIILVFDADHAPFRQFLRESVGLFRREPKLFLVQTPHVFLNPDPIERNLDTFAVMPSENEMFYSLIQRGLDKWNGSFFCGSAALLRREALVESNGFSGITITEDCETAFELHSKGWHSAFIETPLVAGLQPETFGSFVGQRARWCQGMMQIFYLKNPVIKKGLTFLQRLAYLSTMLFWLFPIPRLIFTLAPLLYIFFNIKIVVANAQEAVAYTLVYIFINMMLQNYLYGTVRWPWVSELYEYVQGIFLFREIISVTISPRKPTFNVTAKGIVLDHEQLSELARPVFIFWAVLVIAAIVAGYRILFDTSSNSLLIVVFLWNAFSLIIAGASLGVVTERPSKEQNPSLAIDREAFAIVDGKPYEVRVKSASVSGCSMVFANQAQTEIVDGARGRLFIKPIPGKEPPAFSAEHIKHGLPILFDKKVDTLQAERRQVSFPDLQPRDYFALAELIYADYMAMRRFLDSRRGSMNLYNGSIKFIWWGLREPVRFIRCAVRSLAPKSEPQAAPGATQSAGAVQ